LYQSNLRYFGRWYYSYCCVFRMGDELLKDMSSWMKKIKMSDWLYGWMDEWMNEWVNE